MKRETVSFENAQGQQLAGLMDWPAGGAGATHATALLAHCFTCSKDLRAATRISRALTDAGFAVLRFDFTGIGASEGEFAETTFTTNVDDLLAAADWLRREHEAPALLIGHSLGGTATLRAAGSIDEAKAVVTIGAPAEAAHVKHLFADHAADIHANGRAEVLLGGRPFEIGAEFLDDIEAQPPLDEIRRLRKALLIMHAPLDETVEIDNASRLFANALHPKSFVSLDGADHLLSSAEDASWVGEVIARWASHYIETPAAASATPERAVPEGHHVARTAAGGFRTTIQSGEHRLIADEPASVGGSNTGPTPVGLLASALASCTSMTLQMYARHKKLPLELAEVEVSQSKRRADDGDVTVFTRRIRLQGDLDETVRARMLEIANRCPVHRILDGASVVESELLPA